MLVVFFFLMIRRPPRSTLDRSSAASDVYKRQDIYGPSQPQMLGLAGQQPESRDGTNMEPLEAYGAVSYTHLRAHETVLDLVCRLLLEKKKKTNNSNISKFNYHTLLHQLSVQLYNRHT